MSKKELSFSRKTIANVTALKFHILLVKCFGKRKRRIEGAFA